MPILSVQNLSASQGAKTLFEKISFGIEAGDKIALIGVNGCGKTTLLSMLAQAIGSPHPAISHQQGLHVRYLAQLPVFNPEDRISDHLFRGDSPIASVIRDYHLCLSGLEAGTSVALENQFASLSGEMDRLNAWAYEDRVRSILDELHIDQLDQKMGSLSGGMVKKIALAQVFFDDMEMLILDEPTNHLDIETIEWLEAMLKRFSATLLMVTHDRYFLDKICTRIFEIDQQALFTYAGNYQNYLIQREQRYANLQKAEDTIRSVLRVELEWLRQGPKARSTKQKARKQRIDELVNRNAFSEEKALSLDVAGRRLGKKILELKSVQKSFGDKVVVRDFSYTFKQGEKIGILGPNGAGKTTLFNLITEKLKPDAGEVDVGVNTVFGYFDQHSMAFDLTMTVLDHVKQFGSYVTMHDGLQLSATKLLERFLFLPSSFYTPIGKLSGGERRRLHLVCLLLQNPNFLLFDEPTNDLDIQTLSVLENFLLSFAGCVIVISHDRYFMDRVVDQLLVFKGKGRIAHFVGSYTDYADTVQVLAKVKIDAKQSNGSRENQTPEPIEKRRLSNREQEELKQLETEISDLEKEKKEWESVFLSGAGDAEVFEKAGKEMKRLSGDLDKKYTRWETLAALSS